MKTSEKSRKQKSNTHNTKSNNNTIASCKPKLQPSLHPSLHQTQQQSLLNMGFTKSTYITKPSPHDNHRDINRGKRNTDQGPKIKAGQVSLDNSNSYKDENEDKNGSNVDKYPNHDAKRANRMNINLNNNNNNNHNKYNSITSNNKQNIDNNVQTDEDDDDIMYEMNAKPTPGCPYPATECNHNNNKDHNVNNVNHHNVHQPNNANSATATNATQHKPNSNTKMDEPKCLSTNDLNTTHKQPETNKQRQPSPSPTHADITKSQTSITTSCTRRNLPNPKPKQKNKQRHRLHNNPLKTGEISNNKPKPRKRPRTPVVNITQHRTKSNNQSQWRLKDTNQHSLTPSDPPPRKRHKQQSQPTKPPIPNVPKIDQNVTLNTPNSTSNTQSDDDVDYPLNLTQNNVDNMVIDGNNNMVQQPQHNCNTPLINQPTLNIPQHDTMQLKPNQYRCDGCNNVFVINDHGWKDGSIKQYLHIFICQQYGANGNNQNTTYNCIERCSASKTTFSTSMLLNHGRIIIENIIHTMPIIYTSHNNEYVRMIIVEC